MLELKNVSFSYEERAVLKDINFTVSQGEYVAIIGASGCGKSTLLEVIYGLLHIDQGEVTYKGNLLRGPRYKLVPGETFMKYLPQDFDLMPYTTVAENVGYFLSNIYPEKKRARVMELLEVVEMEEFSEVMVKNLSGGQKQRVALARVLAKEPELMLLDEPFSHIDNFRKNSLRRNVFAYLKRKKISCIVATHDTTDALAFADKTILIGDKGIVAMEHPETLYHAPQSKFVASFFSDVNTIPASLWEPNNENVYLVYPNEIGLSVSQTPQIKAQVSSSFFKGPYYLILAKKGDLTIYFENDTALEVGKNVELALKRDLSPSRLLRSS